MKLVDTSSSTESDVVGSSHTISYGGLLINGSTPDDIYTIKMPSIKGSAYKLKVKIDSGNKIYESDETDNGWVSTDFPTHVRPTISNLSVIKNGSTANLSGTCTNSEANGTLDPGLYGVWSADDSGSICNLGGSNDDNNKLSNPDNVTSTCTNKKNSNNTYISGNVTFTLKCASAPGGTTLESSKVAGSITFP